MNYKYSVLMTVYHNENPEYLRASIDSMLSQTCPPDDFVLVCDGPLTPPLDDVIRHFLNHAPNLFQIIRLPENLGIGAAANEGLPFCKNEFIAKMDSDDIAIPERCEKQLNCFLKDDTLEITGGQIAEFYQDIRNIVSQRRVPLTHQEILKYARRRSPFNNQTVMYKKTSVLSAGGYSSLRRCEDYELFVRMLLRGCKSSNCRDVLVYYRISEDTFKKRGSFENLKCFFYIHLQAYIKGFCGPCDVLIPCIGQLIVFLTPTCIRKHLYRCALRDGQFHSHL